VKSLGLGIVLLATLAGLGCGGDGEDAPDTNADRRSADTATTSPPAAEDEDLKDYEVDLAIAMVNSRSEFRDLPPADASDLEGFARRMLAMGRLHGDFADEAEEFDPPPALEDVHEDMLAAVQEQADAYQAAGQAGLKRTVPSEEMRRLLEEAMASDRASEDARKALTDALQGAG
jgi:hypothetical protein